VAGVAWPREEGAAAAARNTSPSTAAHERGHSDCNRGEEEGEEREEEAMGWEERGEREEER